MPPPGSSSPFSHPAVPASFLVGKGSKSAVLWEFASALSFRSDFPRSQIRFAPLACGGLSCSRCTLPCSPREKASLALPHRRRLRLFSLTGPHTFTALPSATQRSQPIAGFRPLLSFASVFPTQSRRQFLNSLVVQVLPPSLRVTELSVAHRLAATPKTYNIGGSRLQPRRLADPPVPRGIRMPSGFLPSDGSARCLAATSITYTTACTTDPSPRNALTSSPSELPSLSSAPPHHLSSNTLLPTQPLPRLC